MGKINKAQLLFLVIFSTLTLLLRFKTPIYAYTCGSGKYCNAGDASFPVSNLLYCGTPARCFSCSSPIKFKCSCSNGCGPSDSSCSGGATVYSNSSCSQVYQNLGCCATGGGGGSPCTPKCPTTVCTVTDAQCATANSGNTEYKATSSGGALCKGNDASCTNSDGCGGSKVCNTSSCYKPETNIKPSTPTSITMKIDNSWTSPNLSTNINARTLVRFPHTTTISTTIPTISAPSTSRGVGASININSTEHKASTGVFTINNHPASATLTQGATGTISARNYAINKCDDNVLYSDARAGYYKVNTLPLVNSAEITGNGKKNSYGCEPALKHTGKIDNNELTITVKGTDPDGNNSMNGVVVWLVKEGQDITSSINALTYVGPGVANVNPNQIGLFIAQNGTLYKADNSSGTLLGWGRDTQDNPAGTKIVKDAGRNTLISDVRLVEGYPQRIGGETIFAIKLTFPENSPIYGTYQLYAGMTDELSYVSLSTGMSLDQRSTKKITGQTWSFDFTNPTVATNVTSYDEEAKRQLIKLRWTATDTGTGIPGSHTVVNIYKNNASPVYLGATPINVISIPNNAEEIGLLSPLSSGWIDSEAGGVEKSIDMNIRDNDRGNFSLYVTAYDKACNRSNRDGQSVDLDKWIATKGGLFYSHGAISFTTKEVVGNDYNLGTELIFIYGNPGGFFDSINIVRILEEDNKMPALAKNIRNRSNERGLYAKLNSNLKEKIGEGGMTPLALGGNITCNNPNGCYLKLEENQGLPNNITYSGKIVIYSEGDIRIGDTIKSTKPNEDVMYIFSEGNISIGGEQNSDTNTPLAIDSIDAFLMAGGKVTIQRGTQNDSDAQDQVVVTGGIIGFADSTTPPTAISLQRSLGTLNLSQPTLVVNYHPKYSVESSKFFGLWSGAYKRELGFKPG